MARPVKNEDERFDRPVTTRYRERDIPAVRGKAEKAGLSLSEYIRIQSIEGEVVVNQADDTIRELVAEVNRIGTNLNQLARKANATGRFETDRIEELCGQIETVMLKAMEVLEHGPDNRAKRKQL